MARIDVATILGTRPEAIKMAPVLRALEAQGMRSALVCTGQHADLDLAGCGVTHRSDAHLRLEARGLHANEMCDRIEGLVQHWLHRHRPRLVLVQGDTNSALAGARAARRCGIPVGHVEAGLRTFNLQDPWPEERNRVEIDRVAALLFAPTPAAAANLRRENVPGAIVECGNSGIDALLSVANALARTPPTGRPSILVTVHRRENRGAGMRSIGEALARIAAEADVEFVIPLHVNRQARSEMLAATAGLPNLRLLEPQGFRAMISLILQSRCILRERQRPAGRHRSRQDRCGNATPPSRRRRARPHEPTRVPLRQRRCRPRHRRVRRELSEAPELTPKLDRLAVAA